MTAEVAGRGAEARAVGKPSVARERILSTAHRLFYRVGVRAVGVDRVIAESEVARMTFFRHFPTKDDLVVAFLEQQATLARIDLTRARAAAGADGPRAVLEWVAAGITTEPAVEGFRGCEFINTAAEFCDPSHPVRQLVDDHRAWIRDQLQDALATLGHPSPRPTAELLLMVRTGAIVAASLEGLPDGTAHLMAAWWSLAGQVAPTAT